MGYLSCPRCGLTVYQRHSEIALQYCPRCIAHARVPVLMEASTARSTERPTPQPHRSRSLRQPRAGRARGPSAPAGRRPSA
jgi:Zn-finger nucleic acid-binding protein